MASIGQASRKTKVSESTIRRLEERGLIKPPRLPVGPRNFREKEIQIIKQYKKKYL